MSLLATLASRREEIEERVGGPGDWRLIAGDLGGK